MSKDLGKIVRTQEQMQAIARLDAHRNAKLIYWNSTNANKKSLAECNYPKYPGYDNDLKLVKGSSAFCYHIHFVTVGIAYVGVYLSCYDYMNTQGDYLQYNGPGGGFVGGGITGATWLNSNIDILSLVDKGNCVRFECGYFAPIGVGGAHVNLYHDDSADTWFAGTGTFTIYGEGCGELGGIGNFSYGKWF
ncbi:hypothetical protein [Candidatus Tisiphia endosymbiont of Hybos culiciformis]|uniref:hypothetical protein n=1 Tax=Candidatus Tisiphia endosymbiont of Hybos culiciformis TaxID=3139331 RepID=UPI003CCAE113